MHLAVGPANHKPALPRNMAPSTEAGSDTPVQLLSLPNIEGQNTRSFRKHTPSAGNASSADTGSIPSVHSTSGQGPDPAEERFRLEAARVEVGLG